MSFKDNELIYSTDIDYEKLYSLDYAGVIQYAKEKFSLPLKSHMSFEAMAYTMLNTCKSVGLTPDNEQFLFIITNMNRVLCESCAGSGKTTMSQLSVMKYKLVDRIPAENILCLAYNNNAVEDMQNRHRELVNTLNKVLKASYEKALKEDRTTKSWGDIMISPDLRCKTIHSLAREWVITFHDHPKINIDPYNFFIDEDHMLFLMEKSALKAVEDNPLAFVPDSEFKNRKAADIDKNEVIAGFTVTPQNIDDLIRVYGFAKETLTIDKPDEWAPVMPNETGPNALNRRQMRLIFEVYEKYKRVSRKCDFNDLLNKFYTIVTDPEMNARLRMNYKVLLVDEYQDVTPSMLRIIKAFAEGYENIQNPSESIPRYDELKLICVGDTDQSIYGYRGTDPKNCIRFKADYMRPDIKDARILSMSVNRRCAKGILESAEKVIRSSAQRIDKPINGIREGGSCELVRFTTPEDQIEKVVSILRSMDKKEWGKTVICYRNNSSSQHIGLRLYRDKIPFRNLKSSEEMFSDKVSRFAQTVLKLFRSPNNREHAMFVLYRCLPTGRGFRKADLEELLKEKKDDIRFWELDIGSKSNNSVEVANAMATIFNCYKIYKDGGTLAAFMPEMFALFDKKRNFFLRGSTEEQNSYYAAVREWYSRDITVYEQTTENNQTNDYIKSCINQGTCISMSTFHGLKGLEFKNVIIIDMYQNQIPGADYVKQCKLLNDPSTLMSNSASLDLVKKQAFATLEESKRLFYVAITRAKDKCWILEPAHGASELMVTLSPNVNKGHYLREDESSSRFVDIVSNSKDIFKESDIDVRSLKINANTNIDMGSVSLNISGSESDNAVVDLNIKSVDNTDFNLTNEFGTLDIELPDDLSIPLDMTKEEVSLKDDLSGKHIEEPGKLYRGLSSVVPTAIKKMDMSTEAFEDRLSVTNLEGALNDSSTPSKAVDMNEIPFDMQPTINSSGVAEHNETVDKTSKPNISGSANTQVNKFLSQFKK